MLDNPPFSILAKILHWYTDRGIDYFLFEPALTALSKHIESAHHVIIDAPIVYENGAKVQTSFVTNLEPAKIRTAPELERQVKKVCAALNAKKVKHVPSYSYPNHVLTAAMMKQLSKYGIDYRVYPEDSYFIRSLDSQHEKKKTIFGGGYLLSEKAAAEKAAAEKAACEKKDTTVWELSEREKEIIRGLGK